MSETTSRQTSRLRRDPWTGAVFGGLFLLVFAVTEEFGWARYTAWADWWWVRWGMATAAGIFLYGVCWAVARLMRVSGRVAAVLGLVPAVGSLLAGVALAFQTGKGPIFALLAAFGLAIVGYVVWRREMLKRGDAQIVGYLLLGAATVVAAAFAEYSPARWLSNGIPTLSMGLVAWGVLAAMVWWLEREFREFGSPWMAWGALVAGLGLSAAMPHAWWGALFPLKAMVAVWAGIVWCTVFAGLAARQRRVVRAIGIAIVSLSLSSVVTFAFLGMPQRLGYLAEDSLAGLVITRISDVLFDADDDGYFSVEAGGLDPDDHDDRVGPFRVTVPMEGGDAGDNPEIRNVVIVVVDALRADVLSEPDPDVTPFLASQTDRVIRFSRAYPPGNSTRTSIPSMVHGTAPKPPYVGDAPTMFQHLAVDASFLVFGDFAWMDQPDEIGVASDIYRFIWQKGPGGRFSPIAADVTRQRLDATDGDEPLLLFDFVADPHGGYVCDDGTEGGRECYFDEVRAVDGAMRDIVAALEQRGMLDETLVILTADHGEEFAERGHWGQHATNLHEYQVHVPLWMWWPGAEPRVVKTPVSSGGLASTVADALDQSPDPGWTYPSLLPLAAGQTQHYPVPIIHHWTDIVTRIPVRRTAYQTPDWKLVVDWRSGRSWLYDVRPGSDVWDLRDVSDSHPDVARELRARFLGPGATR